MVNAMCIELKERNEELRNYPLESVYFGGGTPSILPDQLTGQIFGAIRQNFDLSQIKEITLEANPDDITAEKVQLWKSLGVNRLSIGIQSFDEVDLRWMNRAHTPEQSLNSIRTAQENGISNLTIDLMYGLPEMSPERWKKQIQTAIDTGVQHISAYCLTVEERTALYKKVQREELIPSDQELQSEHFDLLINTLTENGFLHYEISNFGKPGFLAVHNSNYWKGQHYLGIGPSAHSFDGVSRTWNVSNNLTYMKELENGVAPYEREVLTAGNQFNELLLTGLRTMWGVDLKKLGEILEISEEFNSKVKYYCEKNWMTREGTIIYLTSDGKHYADAIAEDLFEI